MNEPIIVCRLGQPFDAQRRPCRGAQLQLVGLSPQGQPVRAWVIDVESVEALFTKVAEEAFRVAPPQRRRGRKVVATRLAEPRGATLEIYAAGELIVERSWAVLYVGPGRADLGEDWHFCSHGPAGWVKRLLTLARRLGWRQGSFARYEGSKRWIRVR